MKHDNSGGNPLRGWLDTMGIGASDRQVELISRYADAILSENERVNLTAIRELRDALRLHVLDSAVGVPEVNAAPPGRICDLGTGGGFPGVVLALLTSRDVVLLDSVRKKTEAIDRALDATGIGKGMTVYWGRSEDLAKAEPGSFAVVTARAVAELPVLLELAAPLLRDGGHLVAFKGAPSAEEIERADTAGDIVGLRLSSSRHVNLPEGGEGRTLLAYAKVSASRVRLPRHPGVASKSPLA